MKAKARLQLRLKVQSIYELRDKIMVQKVGSYA